MKRIIEFFVLLVLIGFGFTFCVKDPAPEELGTSLNIVFPPPPLVYGTDTDQDGNIFKTIEIGDQTWMAENLRTTKYNDGTHIPNVTDWYKWSHLSTGAYCWYNNNEYIYRREYGAFYNGFTVTTGKLCPTGWHVPTLSDWKILLTYLGGWEVAGGKLKESGTTHWNSPNRGATNRSGFTALPGGTHMKYYRLTADITCSCEDPYNSKGLYSEWWSATPDTNLQNALLILGLNNKHERVWYLDTPGEFSPEQEYGREMFNGCYARCIKDN